MIKMMIPIQAVCGGSASVTPGRSGVVEIRAGQDGPVNGYWIRMKEPTDPRFVPAGNVKEIIHEYREPKDLK